MKFNDEINSYILGEKFSAGLDIPFFEEKYPAQTRLEKIIEITQNKRVIHIGCADHLPLIDVKIKKNKWLHGLLLKNTAYCIGVDNNEEAVNYITNKLGIENVFCRDILVDNLEIIDNSYWDYIILGEIIEHIDNPVDFLKKIQFKFAGKVDKILITAPNIFNLETINDIKKNTENINTDHRYWFSPYTLVKIVTSSGFANCELFFAERVKLPLFKAIIRRMKSFLGLPTYFRANCFSNIILIADFDKISVNNLE